MQSNRPTNDLIVVHINSRVLKQIFVPNRMCLIVIPYISNNTHVRRRPPTHYHTILLAVSHLIWKD